jgi:hypothetical protein
VVNRAGGYNWPALGVVGFVAVDQWSVFHGFSMELPTQDCVRSSNEKSR